MEILNMYLHFKYTRAFGFLGFYAGESGRMVFLERAYKLGALSPYLALHISSIWPLLCYMLS